MLLALLLAQAAPDLELGANVRARSVTIEKNGRAELTVRSEPEGGNLVEVRAPEANGRRTLRDVNVTVRGQARIADPSAPALKETSTPQ